MNSIFNKDSFTRENIIISEEEIKGLYRYKELLVEWNDKINLTAIVEDKEVLYKHFIDSLLLTRLEEFDLKGKKLIDVGTGAGFPGLPLATINKDLNVTLSDSLKKRLSFLELVVEELKLQNVSLAWGRAEDLGRKTEYREQFDYAVARAVSKLPILLEYTLPFLKKGGIFVAYKGPDYETELKESERALKELGAKLLLVKNFKIKAVEMERNLLLFEKVYDTPKKYPRKAGIPQKKPL